MPAPLTLSEVLVGPVRAGRVDQALFALERLRIATQPLPADAPLRLALLRAETTLKLPDCWVLLAAEHVGACVATFDHRLAGAVERRGLTLLDG